MPEWLSRYLPESWGGRNFLIGALAITLITFVLSIVICVVVVIRIPHDYFVCDDRGDGCRRRHPLVHWPLVIGKNLLGLFLVLLGIVMSLPGVPGQGILTILLGVMLVDFPGKRRFERWLLRRRGVLRTINRMRARYGRPPLLLDAAPPPA
jgi:hypothetical protein